ncbi:hypothetical protein MGL_0877 [Malassezia globosa CBS 7966]|uniref:Aprataxin C2HE/C2H2/C2HC zinc finger domain-containing protein n=1 Tax=Malassezia globosa (strain ATCC MYA-4612 / CBS 7966) TaxID=425265 RepID=A8PVI4_MALGO|nr:uncharacterized protein MGL_0877 [Malassezia globosa CBS 7966]EDP44395.1 hypothetical protein MGL_0877 [Malassezia globosa CBS 7966]
MPPDMLVDHDPYTYTICDGYAKAQYHFLILPRIPFYIDVQDQGISTRVQVPTRDLDSIQALLQSRHASAVLDRLGEARHRLVHRIHASMRQARIEPHGHYAFYPCSDDKDQHAEGVAWHVHCGFHSVPSMRHLHLHVISNDLVSNRLKHKKVSCIGSTHMLMHCSLLQHYLSFHPAVGFSLPLEKAQALAAQGVSKVC